MYYLFIYLVAFPIATISYYIESIIIFVYRDKKTVSLSDAVYSKVSVNEPKTALQIEKEVNAEYAGELQLIGNRLFGTRTSEILIDLSKQEVVLIIDSYVDSKINPGKQRKQIKYKKSGAKRRIVNIQRSRPTIQGVISKVPQVFA